MVKQEMTAMINNQDDQILQTKEELILSHKKLGKERSDFQIKFNELQLNMQEMFGSYE